MVKRSLFASLAAVSLLFASNAWAQDDGFNEPILKRLSIESCLPPTCVPLDVSPIDDFEDDQAPDATDPIEVDPLPGLVGDQIQRLRELLLRLHFTNCWGHSRGKVWDILQGWLEGLGLPNVPSDFDVLDADGNRQLLEDFLRRLKVFLKTKHISDLRNLLAKLKKLFANRADIVAILNELLRLIEGLDGNTEIPQWIIDLLHDLIRDLLFEPVPKTAAAAAGTIDPSPCGIPVVDPMIASALD